MDGSGRAVRSNETWAAARADYLAGASGREVCARRGLSLAALKKRAQREGWLRRDQPDPDPGPDPVQPAAEWAEDLDEELEADGPGDLDAMAERALRMAQRAVRLGDLAGSRGWTRLWRELTAAAGDPERARLALEAQCARTDAAIAHAAQALDAAGPALEALGRVHPVPLVSPENTPETPAPLLNRHERRRRDRLAALRAHKPDG